MRALIGQGVDVLPNHADLLTRVRSASVADAINSEGRTVVVMRVSQNRYRLQFEMRSRTRAYFEDFRGLRLVLLLRDRQRASAIFVTARRVRTRCQSALVAMRTTLLP
jgi:hypothetical protein